MATTRRDFMKLSAASVGASLFVPSDVFARYETSANDEGNDVVLRCCVMSDVHFNGRTDSAEYERFGRAVDFTYRYAADQAYKNFDALVVVGDMSNHGNNEELSLFKKAMDAAVKPGTQKVLCMGNHEFYGGNQEFWRSVFGVEPNARYEVNGFRFIMLSPEKGTMKDGDYNYVVDYLDKELADAYAQDQEKPIFVCQHYPVSPTVYGGRGWDDWGADDLFDTLQKYPTAVDFSGHTHYPINDPRCAWQGCFSAFGTGTLSYLCHGHEGYRFRKYFPDDYNHGQFYILEVRRDNSVTLKPYDLTTNSFFDVVYFVAKPGQMNEYVYTDARYSTSEKPTWRDGTSVQVEVEGPNLVKIEFKQAFCPDTVVGYRVDLQRRAKGTSEWLDAGARHFWSLYYLRDMPELAQGELDNLDADSEYRAKVTALNPFMRESDKAIEFAFATPVDPNEPEDKNAPYPNANFYDVRVENGQVVNAPVNKRATQFALEKHGEPKIVAEPLLGGASVIAFSGKDYYKSPNSEEDIRALRRGAIVARFMVDESATGANAIFGNTQFCGLEFSYNDDEKLLKLWINIDGNYTILTTPMEKGRYYDAAGVYDGETVLFYLDGKEVARKSVRGAITYTKEEKCRAFVFGGDIALDGGGEALMRGRIARARVYTYPLSQEQVKNLASRE